MKANNKFYVANLNEHTSIFAGYSWASGEWTKISDNKISSTPEIDVRGYSRIKVDIKYTKAVKTTLYFLDENKSVVGNRQLQSSVFDEDVEAASYIAIEIEFSVEYSGFDDYEYTRLKEVKPHYKNLKKQQKKESGQMFFRESLEGKITLWGSDYAFIKNMSVENKLGFYIYRRGTLFSSNEFAKSDCNFNHFKCSVELKLKPQDKYTKLFNAYENTYDLIKLPIAKSFIGLTKRSAIQIYIQGSNVVTNYVSGTWWEDEVTEVIDDAEALLNKYFFAKGPSFSEISLSGFNYDINSVFKIIPGQRVLNGTSIKVDANGKKYKFPCSIVFTKIGSAGEGVPQYDNTVNWGDGPLINRMSDGTTAGYRREGDSENGYYYFYLWDTYRIDIYTGNNGTGNRIYRSEYAFGNDSNFVIAQGSGLYKMLKISQPAPNKEPSPASFYLGENIINYQIWGRLLCDVDVSANEVNLHDLPYDDFVTERANFKKCIGLSFNVEETPLMQFKQNDNTQEQPTPYGLNDYGEYFVAPEFRSHINDSQRLFAYPLARSTWGNTSLWLAQENSELLGVESWSRQYYKEIWHRDCMEIGAVIKALLNKIDSSIQFESSIAFSEYLYSTALGMQGANGLIYITQKSNILKGEYDQAAQKAEITFSQIMDMLRDCYRCYWFIDSNNRFRIEHVRFFMNGGSYTSQNIQIDLTQKHDKFNKKLALYGQQEVAYNKAELKSRYEFAWADSVTEAMGGGFYVDVHSNLVEQGEKEDINIAAFTPDIDYMMFKPNDFSSDGFALIVAKDGRVPIIYDEIYDGKYEYAPMRIYVQNYNASFIRLFYHYMYDMPAASIISSVDRDLSRYTVKDIKKCMEQKIEIPFEPEVNNGFIKTDIGNGFIDNVSTDIDTNISNITLVYTPR